MVVKVHVLLVSAELQMVVKERRECLMQVPAHEHQPGSHEGVTHGHMTANDEQQFGG
jgi:hypothetical protein